MFQIVWQWLSPDKIVAIATAVYAVVTLVMFLEIRRQTRATRRQAEIAKQQVEVMGSQSNRMQEEVDALKKQLQLQAVAMRQWVMLTQWEHSILSRDQERSRLEVKLIVTNPTKYPLKLLGCKVICRGVTGEECVYHTLVPDEPFTVRFSTQVTAEEINQRENEGLVIRLSGRVAFIDILDTRQDQTFSGFLLCKGQQTYFTAEVSDIKAQQEEEG